MDKVLKNKKNIGINIFAIMMVLVLIFVFVSALSSNRKPIKIFSISFFIVSSSSMAPEYPVNSLVITHRTPIKKLEVGDVIVYSSNALSGAPALHRITRFTDQGFYVKGDNNELEDNQIVVDDIYIGKSICKLSALGRYLSSIKNPLGFFLFFFSPILAVFLFYLSLKVLLKR